MAEKSFGVKEINLIGASGTPTIESPNNLNLNAVNVAISTNATIGGNLTVSGTVGIAGTLTYEDVTNVDAVGIITARDGINVTGGVSTFAGITTVTGNTLFAKQVNVSGVSTFQNASSYQFTVGAGNLQVNGNSIYGSSKVIIMGGGGGDTQYYSGGSSYSDHIFKTLQGGSQIERFRVGKDGDIGLSGENYGTSGQVLTSGGSGSAATWAGIAVTEAPVTDYTISANGSSAYRIHGGGVDETANSPDLYLIRGQKYRFNNTTGSSHPFAIRVSNGGSAYTDGVSGDDEGVQLFTVPYAAPASLVYQCTIHGGMVGNIYIRGGSSTVTINNNANNRIITGNTGATLDAESTLTYDGNTLKFGGGSAPSNTTYYNDIVIDNSDTASGAAGGAGIKLYSGNQTWGGIIFGDSDADQVGYIKYSHIDNYLTLAASGSERLRIESTGGGTISAKNCTGAFAVPLGTTAQRPTGATGMVRYNTTTNKLEAYNGTSWKSLRFSADPFSLSYLVIGGGGAGGGNYRGGGGGAGGYRTNWNSENQGGGQSSGSTFTVNPDASPSYSIVVGAGGAGASNTHGGDGGQSKFDTITSDGGGGGGHYSSTDGRDSPGNGSGGGGGSPSRAGGSSGTYGYDGGTGGPDNQQCGGGGGGAAAAGQNGGNSGTSGDGGTALASTITGSSVLRAGGGGGGSYGGGNDFPVGGGGGAGNGVFKNGAGGSGYTNGLPATANTGSGGGGASGDGNGTGGNGGSGVVILRYPSTATATYSSGVTKTTSTVGSDTVDIITATATSGETVTFSG